jgi:hypothetical protein
VSWGVCDLHGFPQETFPVRENGVPTQIQGTFGASSRILSDLIAMREHCERIVKLFDVFIVI